MKSYQEVYSIAGGFLKRICSKTNSISDKLGALFSVNQTI